MPKYNLKGGSFCYMWLEGVPDESNVVDYDKLEEMAQYRSNWAQNALKWRQERENVANVYTQLSNRSIVKLCKATILHFCEPQ